ncbi:copper resistance CopC family protein, partial [Microbacterium sp.]|uniref:copper resistance CopC family protein n=1 Tax=Microbacterium sp. TaxID=51671 RepID=UPI003C786C6E
MPRRLAKRLASAFAVIVVSILLVAIPAESASAHASVVATTPEHGAELDAAPTAVTVTFSEPVTLSSLLQSASVLDADGAHVEAGPATLDDARLVLTIPLPADLPVGAYIASWRVVSSDTHPVGGSIQFGVGVPASTISPPAPPVPSATLALGVGVAKGVLYLGLVLAFGLLPPALLLGAGPRERRTLVRWSRVGVGVAAVASLAQLVLQFLWIRSAGDGGEWQPEAVTFMQSPFALAVAVRVVVLAAATVVLSVAGAARAPRGRVATLVL